jgi:hypothetical protein
MDDCALAARAKPPMNNLCPGLCVEGHGTGGWFMERSKTMEEAAAAGMSEGAERRKQQRFLCEGPAEVVSYDSRQLYHGEVKDLSLTGCYVKTGHARVALDRRAQVELCLRVNGDSLTTPARVIMVRQDSGVALEFLAIDPEMRVALLDLIEKLSSAVAATGHAA